MSTVTTTDQLGSDRIGARPASGQHDLVLTRRGRVVIALLVAVLFLLAARVGGAVAGTGEAPQEVRVHVVQAGETFWGFASDLAAPGQDLRDVVDVLHSLNGASSSDLQVGQRILLPVERG
ncbi:LysM peptidoglycan-binding domain-containing protein [Cellulosimicrobium arenosum]|uniref:LysM peptidoglycan-binding domain-containing protein n=1 Tax=Cellulosimicrobium arenosum TaxID=2708133 RepID=A0A927GAE7_9MICO|nr:LysM peptidoglycan-binding domain-containing protein [Cellulosimicrobium arenosum]MBD8079220.1 LysM peptidoglycan-binding domain-containing protein [Cellulosimicrobium arenosum]